jgi:hypothetical protein
VTIDATDEKLVLTWFWSAVAQPVRDYTLFLHVLDADGAIVAQYDGQPQGGLYPTAIWDVGERVRDTVAVSLPENAVALGFGAYDGETGAPLALPDGTTRLIVPLP